MADKIIMTKGQKLTLDKPAGPANGDILIHTDWDETPGLAVDVDLGVLYELKSGFNKKGVVQALGNSFGSLINKPYIALDRDDRTGATSGETLRAHYQTALDHIQRLGVFVYVYSGVDSLEYVRNGVTTIQVPGCKELRIEHRGNAHQYRTCAIALIEQSKHGFTVRMDTAPINGWQQDVDRHWGWGMRWSSASK